MNKKEKKDRYAKRMLSISRKLSRARKGIMKTGSIVLGIGRFLLPLLLSPLFIIFFIIMCFFALILYHGSNEFIDNLATKLPYEVLTTDDILALGLEVYEDGKFKGKIIGCEDNTLPKKVFSSDFDGLVDDAWLKNTKLNASICMYHQLFIKKINGELDPKMYNKYIDKASELLMDTERMNEEKIKSIEELKSEYENKKTDLIKVLEKIKLKSTGENKIRDYNNDETGFFGLIDFPISYFEKNNEDFEKLMFYDYIARTEGSPFPEGISVGGGFFGGKTTVIYNIINELDGNVTDKNLFKDYLNNEFGLPDFIEEIADRGEYYDYNCPKCRKEGGCECSGDPKKDYRRTFESDNISEKYMNKYLIFMRDLITRKIIYVNGEVKSPFRNYIRKNKLCIVDIKLTQRDGVSYYFDKSFSGYPIVDGLPTHAGLDIVGISDCDNRKVPVYPIIGGIVVSKTYSLTAWGNSIIIKSQIGDMTLYIRYSHLETAPIFKTGDIVDQNIPIGTQGDSGPGSGKHLDVTIYDNSTSYKDYLRDTLNWGGIFDFTFEDMFSSTFSDYDIGKYWRECYNCEE